MDEVYQLLMDIRKCPNIYLGRPSIELLNALISGFVLGSNAKSHCLIGFNEYIADRYNIHTGQSWVKILRFFSPTDEYAFNLFYEYLEKYMSIPEERK